MLAGCLQPPRRHGRSPARYVLSRQLSVSFACCCGIIKQAFFHFSPPKIAAATAAALYRTHSCDASFRSSAGATETQQMVLACFHSSSSLLFSFLLTLPSAFSFIVGVVFLAAPSAKKQASCFLQYRFILLAWWDCSLGGKFEKSGVHLLIWFTRFDIGLSSASRLCAARARAE